MRPIPGSAASSPPCFSIDLVLLIGCSESESEGPKYKAASGQHFHHLFLAQQCTLISGHCHEIGEYIFAVNF